MRTVANQVRDVAAVLIAAEKQIAPDEAADVMKEVARLLKNPESLKGPMPAMPAGKTAAEIEAALGGGLAKAIAMAILLGLGGLANAAQAADIVPDVSDAASQLQTIRVEEGGTLPGPQMGSLSNGKIKIVMTTKAHQAAYKVLNKLDKKLAEDGVNAEGRVKSLTPLVKSMGMLGR